MAGTSGVAGGHGHPLDREWSCLSIAAPQQAPMMRARTSDASARWGAIAGCDSPASPRGGSRWGGSRA